MIYDRQKVEKVFWFRDFFMFKGLCIYSTKKGCKVLNEVCEWGPLVNLKVYERGHFSVGWTSWRSSLYKTLSSSLPSPGWHGEWKLLLPFESLYGG